MIHYNSPNHTEERAASEPLEPERIGSLVNNLNIYLTDVPNLHPELQRFIYQHEKLQHFWDNVGGWDGLEKLKSQIK